MLHRWKSYVREPWNLVDVLMYLLLAVAIILRLLLANDKAFEWARYVYTVDLIMFYLRILQLYSINQRLGPKVIVIWRMVCIVIVEYLSYNIL